MSKHTPGPWFSDAGGRIWRRDPKELYENGGNLAGDKPLATVHRGWHHEGSTGFPVEANARLIEAAPELLEMLQRMVTAAYNIGGEHVTGHDLLLIAADHASEIIAKATA